MTMEVPRVCKQSSEENTEEMSKLLTRSALRYGGNSLRKLGLLCDGNKKKRTPTVDREAIVEEVEKNFPQSTRWLSNLFSVSYSSARNTLKHPKFKAYRPYVFQALNEDTYSKRIAFAKWPSGQMKHSSRFIERLLFSDESVFHLEQGFPKCGLVDH